MNLENIKAYVTKADTQDVRVKLLDLSMEPDLLRLGFTYDKEFSEYTTRVPGQQQKAKLFTLLRDKDICFSGGREWCPAEVFEYLRESGFINGEFKKITWRGPDDYRVTVY